MEFIKAVIDKIGNGNKVYILMGMTIFFSLPSRTSMTKWRTIYYQAHANLGVLLKVGRFSGLGNCLLTNYFSFHSLQNSFHFTTNEIA